jgi:hypothetical protein
VKPKIRRLSRGPLGEAAISNGFLVTKIQMKKCKLTGEITVFEEFSITIPPKYALLFLCQRAISIDALGCQVQHLIVLDVFDSMIADQRLCKDENVKQKLKS